MAAAASIAHATNFRLPSATTKTSKAVAALPSASFISFGATRSPLPSTNSIARLSCSRNIIAPRASETTAAEDGSYYDMDAVPTPKVIIDLDSDPDATVVEVTFGDRLGALVDTMTALKNLGLNVVKGNVFLDSSGKHNRFAITKADSGRKVEDPELLEAIRCTIINNLLKYHPESSSKLAMGVFFGAQPPNQVDVDIATHITISNESPNRSLLNVETADRPGLLVDLVKVINDTNIAVESGEFDTEVQVFNDI
ncbi:unnamed protein product [Linum tenue]|uniref:ACT domain-containing protein ACR n=1 Tax=Linum tenue TaxID=586396 RepID=A0AAV0M7M5_9ROSI|nr:unnamed protein product [Linum tenue]